MSVGALWGRGRTECARVPAGVDGDQGTRGGGQGRRRVTHSPPLVQVAPLCPDPTSVERPGPWTSGAPAEDLAGVAPGPWSRANARARGALPLPGSRPGCPRASAPRPPSPPPTAAAVATRACPRRAAARSAPLQGPSRAAAPRVPAAPPRRPARPPSSRASPLRANVPGEPGPFGRGASRNVGARAS